MTNHRLLVVEDDEDILGLVTRIATQEGFDVRGLSDVNKLESVLEDFKPQAVILDILMPDKDGFEVLNILHERECNCQVVILSAHDGYRPMASRMAEGFNIRIVATVAKPFTIPDLRLPLAQMRESLSRPAVHPRKKKVTTGNSEVAA